MPILFFMTIYGEYFIIKHIENKNFPVIVGLGPTQLFYDDENKQLYVSNTNSHTVSVIKDRSNFVKFNLICSIFYVYQNQNNF